MTRTRNRVGACSEADARRRLDHARQFLDVAELAADDQREDGSLEYGNAAATLAVLAGIAAIDAACCKALGVRSRADDHRSAETLVAEITDGGTTAAKSLRGLLAVKDTAQYGFYSIGPSELTRALRQARATVTFAEGVLRS